MVRPSIEDPKYKSLYEPLKPTEEALKKSNAPAQSTAQVETLKVQPEFHVQKLQATKVYTFKELVEDDKTFKTEFKGILSGERKYSWSEAINYYPGETYEDWEKRMKADCLMPSSMIEKSTQYAYFIGDLMVELKKEVELFV